MKQCKNCHQPNVDEALFCETCGSSLDSSAQQEAAQKCLACGQKLDENSKFCSKCGTPAAASDDFKSVGMDEELPISACSHCGMELASDSQFCENCGQATDKSSALQSEYEPDETATSSPEPKPRTKAKVSKTKAAPKKKKRSGLKIFFGILALILIVLGIGGYQYGKNHFKYENQLSGFIDAVKKGDVNKVSEQLSFEGRDSEKTLTKEQLQPFFDYFKEYPEKLSQLEKKLAAGENYFGVRPHRDGKFYFLFDRYHFFAVPAYITLYTNQKDILLAVNQKEVGKSDTENFEMKAGPYLYGIYQIESAGKAEQGDEIKQKQKLSLTSADDSVYLNFAKGSLTITSNVKDAEVYLNDKKIGQLADGKLTTPSMLINAESSIQLKKKTGDVQIETEEKSIRSFSSYDNKYKIELDFDIADEEDALSGIQSFYSAVSSAIQGSSFNEKEFMEKYFVDGMNDKSADGIKTYINWCRERSKKNEYSGVSFKTTIKSFEPQDKNRYKVNYEVTYTTEYPYTTKKDTRIETFLYKDVIILLTENTSSFFKSQDFKFVNMGNGGEKVYDNHPELN